MDLRTLVILLCSLYLAESSQYRKWCYFTNWSQYREVPAKFKPINIDPNLCTHISYAFATLRNGLVTNFELNDISHTWKKGMFQEVTKLKQRFPQLKTYLAIGGWNLGSKPFSDAVLTPNSRKMLIDSAIQLARGNNFDGIEIDWEFPASRGSPPEDKRRFTTLISELKQAIISEQYVSHMPQLSLAAAVASGRSKIDAGYEISTLSGILDFINLMSYDFHGAWEQTTGHNSPLVRRGDEIGEYIYWNLEDAARYWVSNGAPVSKMNIGVPTYGRTFTLSNPYNKGIGAPVSGAGKAGTYTKTEGFVAYYEVCHFLRNGASKMWDHVQKVPYAYKDDQWISYENPESLKLKVEWIKSMGFGGVMIWSLDLDDFAGMCGGQKNPLITTIIETLDNTFKPGTPSPSGTQIGTMCHNKLNGNYPLPNECKKYVTCYNRISQLQICPIGQNYFPASQQCVWENTYPCQQTTPSVPRTMCHNKLNGNYPLPNECKKYVTCYNRISQFQMCPIGQNYFPASQQCVWESTYPCQQTTPSVPRTMCQNKNNGNYPLPNECKKYLMCYNGISQFQICPIGQNYFPASQQCVWESTYPCQQTTPSVSPMIKIGGKDISRFCRIRGDGLYDSPNACDEYIYCTTGKTILSHCRIGQYFNPKTKYCIYKDQVPCIGPVKGTSTVPIDNFCAYRPNGFYANPTDCHKYYICNGRSAIKMTCLNGQIFENNQCRIINKIC